MRIGSVAAGAVGIVAIGAGIMALLGSDALAGEALFRYDDPAAVSVGKSLYEDHCASCHGADLEGQPNWQIPDQDGFMPAPPHGIRTAGVSVPTVLILPEPRARGRLLLVRAAGVR